MLLSMNLGATSMLAICMLGIQWGVIRYPEAHLTPI